MLVDKGMADHEKEDHAPLWVEQVASGRNTIFGIDEIVESHTGKGGQSRHGVQCSKHNQIIGFLTVVDVGPGIGVIDRDPIALIGVVGMKLLANSNDFRVNLDGIDMSDAFIEEYRHIISGTCT